MYYYVKIYFLFSSRRRHTIFDCDWSSDVCSSDLAVPRRWSWVWAARPRWTAAPVRRAAWAGSSSTPQERRSPKAAARWRSWRSSTGGGVSPPGSRSEEHTSELQSQSNLVCRLLLEKKNTNMKPLLLHR